MATASAPSESLRAISRYSHRYVPPLATARYFAKHAAAHIAHQQVYTIPCIVRTPPREASRVVLMFRNDTIADYWLRQLVDGGNACQMRTEAVGDAMQRCLLLRMAIVVVLNAWCDVATRETEFELHYISQAAAQARTSHIKRV